MHIWPAIDLRGGKCVRLKQGDYERETIYGEDPVAMAQQWIEQGAERLHLVDLDGARSGEPANFDCVLAILQVVGIPCQLGGGIRDTATIERWIDAGVSRLVVGTAALKQPDWFRQQVRRFPQQLVLGLDARDGRVATDGWLETSDTTAVDLARQYVGEPLAAIVYTDIARDGMLAGPNLAEMRHMQTEIDLPIVASGGVSRTEDVAQLAAIPMAGCIIGRSLYEGTMTLKAALKAAVSSG